ncbi:MAG TPA: hypothetical protein VEH31_24115, partial [Streptosporangiaceae bacterium]|nr:hypothetical protein [Streptosporangiaceae bacterium]
MNGRPGAAPVPGGADASEAGLTAPAAGAGPDTGAAGTALDTGAGADPAGTEWDAGPEPAAAGPEAAAPDAAGPDAAAGPAGTGAETAAATRARAMAARLAEGWPLRRTFLVGVVIVTLFSLAAIVVGGAALANLASARDRVVNKIDPAAFR